MPFRQPLLADVIPAQREKFFWPKAELDEHPDNEVVATDQHCEKRSTFFQAQIAFRFPFAGFVFDSDRAAPHRIARDNLQLFRLVQNGAQVRDRFFEERVARAASH